MVFLVFGVLLALLPLSASAQQTSTPAPEEKQGTEKRVELNLLGATDTSRGESKRNENVPFNLIDNNALRELNARLGTSATIVTEFRPELKYFGTEFGNAPGGMVHLDAPAIKG